MNYILKTTLTCVNLANALDFSVKNFENMKNKLVVTIIEMILENKVQLSAEFFSV